MDVSELIPYVVVVLVLATFGSAFVLAKRLGSRWLRWPARGGAASGMVLTTLVLALLTFTDHSCTAREPIAYSPDGKHIAILTWGLQGALGLDIASVDVRHRWIPYAKTAYSGPGWSPGYGDADPQIRWIDNNHLLIRYHTYPGYAQTCEPRVLDIEVVCEHLPDPRKSLRQPQPAPPLK